MQAKPSAYQRRVVAAKSMDPIRTLGKVSSIATFGLFVIILIQYVDARNSRMAEMEDQQSLISQETVSELRVARYQADAKTLNEQLKGYEEQAITFRKLNQVQDELLILAKKHGCTLKKASPRERETIPFGNETSQNKEPSSDPNDPNSNKRELELIQSSLSLNIAGDLNHIVTFLKAIRDQPWIAQTSQLILRREQNTNGGMSLEMELTFGKLQIKQGLTPRPITPKT
jgi:hypothetical protein